MKKRLNDFGLFECTMTPKGLMMRVMGGWELNGAFIPEESPTKMRMKEFEVFDTKNKLDGHYAEIMHKLLEDIHRSKKEIIQGALRNEVVELNVINRLFADLGFVKDCPF